jgi:hypothetical protein
MYVVRETSQALWNCLKNEVFNIPTERGWEKIADEFNKRWNFPHCIGALDGKHVTIQAPALAGSQYFNYKGHHSVVLLALVDANLRFLIIDVGQYGRCSDSSILASSTFGDTLLNGRLNLPTAVPLPPGSQDAQPIPYVVVADEAFPLKPCIMRPYSGRGLPQDKRIFNYRLSRARRTVESAFGLLAARWRIYRRAIIANPDAVVDYIKATCALHNFVGVSGSDLQEFSHPTFNALKPITLSASNHSSREAQRIRDDFRNYFVLEGSVPWQYDSLNRGII